ncbi:hypothetical protein B0H13DRAFT_1896239 [Mycena leptocephala]|nr:hypothetical protein B0H13DRAFT_1896239 [Mycena leptocephala]
MVCLLLIPAQRTIKQRTIKTSQDRMQAVLKAYSFKPLSSGSARLPVVPLMTPTSHQISNSSGLDNAALKEHFVYLWCFSWYAAVVFRFALDKAAVGNGLFCGIVRYRERESY